MGSYIYKVTGKTVDLDNGEKANVALYAYKPYWMNADADKINARLHFKTGCVTCDRNREKRTGWIVTGTKNEDGTITVEPEAFTIGRKFGHFNDDALDYSLYRHEQEGTLKKAKVIATPKNIRIYQPQPPATDEQVERMLAGLEAGTFPYTD